jgi:hypothetical protein
LRIESRDRTVTQTPFLETDATEGTDENKIVELGSSASNANPAF